MTNAKDERRGLADRLAEGVAFWGSVVILALLPFAIYMPLKTPVRGQEYFLKLGVLGYFGLFLLARLFGPARPLKFGVPIVALGLGLASAIVSALLSPSPAYAINLLLPWFAGMALFVMLTAVARGRDIFRPLSWVFVVQALPLAFYAIAQYFGFEVLQYSENVQKNRVISTFGHPNFFGSYIAPVIFICLARGVAAPDLKNPALGRALRIAAVVTAIVAAIALALARARAAWIGTGLGLGTAAVVYALARRSELAPVMRRKWAWGGAALAALVVLMTVVAFAPKRLSSLTEGSQWETRLYFWYVASESHSPFSPIGIGRGGFGRIFWDEVDELQQSFDGHFFRRNHVALTGWQRALDPGNVHNDYLEMWSESGPIALFAHLLLIGYLGYFFALRLLWSGNPVLGPPANPGVKSLLLGGFVCSLFDALLGFPLGLPCSTALFWVLCALLNQYIEHPER